MVYRKKSIVVTLASYVYITGTPDIHGAQRKIQLASLATAISCLILNTDTNVTSG